MKSRIIVLSFLAFSFLSKAQTGKPTEIKVDTVLQNNVNFISAEFMKKQLTIIASDEFEGRETGKEGQRKAANYLAEFYESLGFEPTYNGTFFQDYNISSKSNEKVLLAVNEKKYVFLEDYYFFPKFSDQDIAVNEIVFAGYGIVIPEKNMNDYFGLDVRDKVVVIMESEPVDKNGNSLITGTIELSGWSNNWRSKYEEAKTRGAKALVVITTKTAELIQKNKHALEKPMLGLSDTKDNPKENIALLYVSEELGYKMFDKNQIKKYLSKPRTPKSDVLFSKIPFVFQLTRKIDEEKACNVIACIKGKDKPEEAVVISAHYDHLGIQGDKIYYGADDDGSGTVAVMNLAKAYKELGKTRKGT